MAVSSPERRLALALLVTLFAACSAGEGEGEVSGTLTAVSCELEGEYALNPSFFGASATLDLLDIRVQRGSSLPDMTDGLTVIVHDVPEVQATLGEPIPIALSGADALVQLTLGLGETCPVRPGDGTPVYLSAVEGAITFEALHSPEHPAESNLIAGHFEGVRFEDPGAPEETFATLGGYFEFYYTRGRPAQLFP